MRSCASARSDAGCTSRPSSSSLASGRRPWRTRSSAMAATVGAPIAGERGACSASTLVSACSASAHLPVASSTSACATPQAPTRGVAPQPCSRAKPSTCSHHSAARSHSPALVLALRRLQYASPSVCTLCTRPAQAAAMASSSSCIPASRRAGADLRPAEQAEREDLEVGGARVARDLQRAPGVLGALLDALRMPRPLDGDPPVPRAGADAFHGALGAREPSARGGGAPGDEVLVRDPDGDARRFVAAPVVDVAVERALARRDPLLDAAEEPERLPEAVARGGRLLLRRAPPRTPRARLPSARSRAPADRRGADRRDTRRACGDHLKSFARAPVGPAVPRTCGSPPVGDLRGSVVGDGIGPGAAWTAVAWTWRTFIVYWREKRAYPAGVSAGVNPGRLHAP